MMQTFTRLMAVLVCGVTLAAAQTEPLTVSQAVQSALARHPSLAVSSFDIAAAEAQLRGARARTSPEVRVAAGVPWSTGADEALSVLQSLEVNGARRARTLTATGHLAQARATAVLARTELIRQVKQAYWDAALARQIVELDAETVGYVETVLKAAQTQFELGNQPQVQAYKAEVELARARQQFHRSQAAAAQAVAFLNAALGRPPDATVTLAEEPSPLDVQFEEADLQALGLSQRPDLMAARAAMETARGEVAVARAARRTDVAVGARLEPEGDGGLYASLNFPQLDWGGLRANQHRSEALELAAQQSYQVALNSARADIATALIALRSAQAQTREYREKVLELSTRLADLSLVGYREGASTFLDVLDARRTLRAINVEYYSALADQQKSLAELEFALGGCLPDPTTPAEVK